MEVTHANIRIALETNSEEKACALAELALHFKLRIHLFNNTICDVESETRTLDVPVILYIYPLKSLEQLRKILFPDTASRVLDLERDKTCVFTVGLGGNPHRNHTAVGVLDRIRYKVVENLHQAVLIARHVAGKILRCVDRKSKSLTLGTHNEHIVHPAKEGSEIEPLVAQF